MRGKDLTRVPPGAVLLCLLASWFLVHLERSTNTRHTEPLYISLIRVDICPETKAGPHTLLEHPTMATPLRSLRSSFPSSSQLGNHLRRKSTSACSMTTCFPTTRAPASFPRPRGAVTCLPGAQAVPKSDSRMGTREPRTRLLSSAAAAPLFGDTIIVTKRCAQRVNQLRNSKSQPKLRLRLSVEGGGCSGFQYRFSLEDAVAGDEIEGRRDESEDDPEESDDEDDDGVDHEFERDGAVLVVDETSLGFVKGATVDFEEDMMRSAFAVVNNPVSESACGCGSSFALKNFEKNPALD